MCPGTRTIPVPNRAGRFMSCIVVARPIHFSEAVRGAWLDPNTDRESEHYRRIIQYQYTPRQIPTFFFRYEILSPIQTDRGVI